ncbi:phosphatidylinositol N-acetylglucosaminyltransferase [Ascobolus immersus RN42]|uniref:Phosphatidylinositol N-acetylglucosaminyltransferase n=1 Tax=Ascobolus immersus RN42 TaxID=1160509 RepID=A0A3N4I2Y5_ASCIM|nr:phosphatidylinositol N-acetylglucosaminyltransferase [Ascobolus immersus RN42]
MDNTSASPPYHTEVRSSSAQPSRSRHRRRKPWRKLLWVKQNYPDNWVDSSFLNQLQRNINVKPYDFWTLVADSTVITQHVSSVVIFVTTFIAIYMDKVGPVTVAGGSSVLTVLGYWVWDLGWETREKEERRLGEEDHAHLHIPSIHSRASSPGPGTPRKRSTPTPTRTSLELPKSHSRRSSNLSRPPSPTHSVTTPTITTTPDCTSSSSDAADATPVPPEARYGERTQRRLDTAKSAGLIYCTLLGLSPILKSLTESISPDSIWAMATWLFLANCLAFDYSSGVDVKFPASLSTNAAIMASVVLASRLPTTTHVFSLVLFSIQVFGLSPMFRRYLRHISWNLHVTTTIVLIGCAATGLGLVVGWGWAGVYVLVLVGGVMGGCSWWLMWLQRYKNEIHGPWDPARPVIRRQWGD